MHYDCVACYFLSLPRRLIDDMECMLVMPSATIVGRERHVFGLSVRPSVRCPLIPIPHDSNFFHTVEPVGGSEKNLAQIFTTSVGIAVKVCEVKGQGHRDVKNSCLRVKRCLCT